MRNIRTHYDNLQVARTAAPEVIAAAYRSLSLKYHPDRNGGDERCQDIMRILNTSFAVLSDETQRIAYDQWIARCEEQQVDQNDGASSKQGTGDARAKQRLRTTPKTLVQVMKRYGWILVGAAVVIAISSVPSHLPVSSGLPRYDQQPAGEGLSTKSDSPQPAYLRPARAPNGSPWPKIAAYVKGYHRLRTKGLSIVTIDNSENASDVFVKVVSIEPEITKPVRQFFIPAHNKFTVYHLTPGTYDVRYMDLNDGSLARTSSFILEQKDELGGSRYSSVTMTLYKVANGNMQTFALLPSEF